MSSLEIVRRQTLAFNSFNRSSGTVQDCVFTIPPLVSTLDNVEVIQVIPTSFVTKRSWYSVDTLNNRFELVTLGSPSTTTTTTVISITPGNYNVKTILVALEAALPTPWAVGYDATSNKLRFEPPNDGRAYAFRMTSFFCHQLGFPLDFETLYPLSFATPLYSPRHLQMHGENLLVVRTNLPIVSSGNVDNLADDGQMNESAALIRMPISSPPYDLLVWRSNDVEQNRHTLATNFLTNFHVRITDEFNRDLELQSDWTLSLHVEFYAPATSLDILADLKLIKEYLKFMAYSAIPRQHLSKAENRTPEKK